MVHVGDAAPEAARRRLEEGACLVTCRLGQRGVRGVLRPERQRVELRRRIEDWRGPLTRHVAQARQVLRKVLAERLTVTPEAGEDRYAAITGDGTLTKILAEIVFPCEIPGQG